MEPTTAGCSSGREFVVLYKGQEYTVGPEGSDFQIIRDLKEQLASQTGVGVGRQKLMVKGKALADDSAPLSCIGKGKILLIGTTAAEISELQEHEQAIQREQRVRDSRFQVSIRERNGRRLEPSSNYGFGRLEILPNLPQQEKAKALLKDLASDPGIVQVMQAHKWHVGALKEMYPEGQVGVDEVCVLGLNVNKGQEIKLRLRTDDLQGKIVIFSSKKTQ
jgi:hypothetical protein